MVKVYSWPPVAHVEAEWTVIDPIGRSSSLFTGGSYVSSAQRRRRIATLKVSALSFDRNGAGYMEVLKRLLEGGVNLVRLYSTPINWHLDDIAENAVRTKPMSWILPPDQVDWTYGGNALPWWSGTDVTRGVAGETDGYPSVYVSGLPASTLVARPGEFVTMGEDTAMVMAPVYSDENGEANILLITELATDGTLVIGTQETGVFEALSMPRAVQPTGANWHYSWSFSEVFDDEGRGEFEEMVDIWT